jgi:hypothetical protein
MAEAVAALGVAAAAVQFFDFSLKALSLCKQIRDNEKGATQVNQELENCTKKLKEIFEELKPDVNLAVADRPITKARQDCIAVISDLEKLLADVKLKSSDKNFPAVKAAFCVMKGKRRVEVLQNKLLEAQRRFLAAVSVEIKNNVARLLEEQGKVNDTMHNTILPELRKAYASSTSGYVKTHKKVEDGGTASSGAHKTTHSMLTDVGRGQKALDKQISTMQSALTGDIAKIEARTEKTFTTMQTTNNHKAIMDSLWYAEIFDRQQTIRPPSFDTFEWIFDDSLLPEHHPKQLNDLNQTREQMRGSFARWLRSDNLLFWISGKPGSGKSSLMSLIQDDSRTGETLAGWTQGRRLHTFSFYFWRPGSAIQKRIHGLLRSLLYQLATAKPAIIELISSIRPATQCDWTTKSLIAAFRCALPAFSEDRIFLMVDGLDEYEDQFTELLDLLLECQTMEHIKLCIASRPEAAISAKLDMFPSLRLQDLNAKDIDVYVRGKLGPYTDLVTEGLTSDLIDRANGVFLWAVLVANSMVSGVLAGDDIETLGERLWATPRELNALFAQLLADVDEVHYETLKLCLFHLHTSKWRYPSARCSIGLITASMPASRSITNSAEFLSLCVKTSRRLISSCKGLVEIGHYTYDDQERKPHSAWVFDSTTRKLHPADLYEAELCWIHRIRFVHRSAHDFLFDQEACHSDHSPWALGSEDLDNFARMTFSGVKVFLRYSPMAFENPWNFIIPDFRAAMNSATGLVGSTTGGEVIDVLSWLDEIYGDIGIWYPMERRSIGSSKVWMSGLEPSWSAELGFWFGSLKIDGYIDSRWDVLLRSHQKRAICSGLLRMSFPLFYEPKRSTYELLMTLLEETFSENATTTVEHIRQNEICADGTFTQVSWDASTAIDEQYVAVDLISAAITAIQSPDRQVFHDLAALTALLQRQNVFLGITCMSPGVTLHIQSPLQTVWHMLQSCETTAAASHCHDRFRLLCLKNRGQTTRRQWSPCTEAVVGACDVDSELLGALLDSRSVRDRHSCEARLSWPPTFVGTQADFYCCLEQVKQEIWANKKGQLDAWQQLCMLSCVKKNFEHFWTIVTQETRELAQITL